MKTRIKIHKAVPNRGALDFRHLLDAPAGKRGFVQARNGNLYFEDGARARFLGFNLPARSNTPDRETAEKMAERFASMGVNVVRLHAADAPTGKEKGSWSSCEEAPLIDYARGSSRFLNPLGLDRFEYFIAKLKEKGIYLHIDLYVARAFLPGDGLDYPGAPGACLKCYGMINERLIQLQQEYARALLCHVNPYTGLALKDDPAVMTVQINNEDSAIKQSAAEGDAAPYRAELARRFNHFLLSKYDTRENLAAAWTREGACALLADEDPLQNTVRIVEGGFVQPVCDPLGDRTGPVSPARYADFMEFGIALNRRYYRRMIDFLRALGVKAPIATSNLLGGAADVYGHADADVMENNCYFNHPMLPTPGPNAYVVAGPSEYARVNPLTMQRGAGALATTLVSMAACAAVEGKPFVVSEWNEYGLHPFHSTSYLSTIAYACLNDWDGLILYCHHTSERWDDQPDDEITNIFDAYNDPALICQWGFLAAVFLEGRIAPARRSAHIAYTPADLLSLPNAHAMPNTLLPYILRTRQVFLEDATYRGGADAAVSAGFAAEINLAGAKHAIQYAWSPAPNALRRAKRAGARENPPETAPGVFLNDQTLVFDDIRALSGQGDYRAFARHTDAALKRWGILPANAGLAGGGLISETGEIESDFENGRFRVRAPGCACESGAPEEEIRLEARIAVRARNPRITLALLPEDAPLLADANVFLLTALGETGADETARTPVPVWPGIEFTRVDMRGKLFADTPEGELVLRAHRAKLEFLDPTGRILRALTETSASGSIRIPLDGQTPAVNFRLVLG